jgi:hypothetical protein
MEILNNKNIEQYLRDNYDGYSELEFQEDVSRIKHIKKLITRYITYGPDELRERLILNHIIILNNVFGPHATTRMIFLKMGDILSYIKPFLLLLNILPDKIFNIYTESVIDTTEIKMDSYIIEVLRKL